MSRMILIMGESGSGKTTSMRNLNPKTTFYIDCDKKGLSWKGWRKQYNKENGNYWASSNADAITQTLVKISAEKPQIKTIVIDTLNWVMIDDEFKRMKEKGYDKWQDLAFSVKEMVAMGQQLREDLTVIFTAHTQTERDDSGFAFTRMKTSGKKLDKISIESMFTTVLLAKCVDGKYLFETQSDNSTAKSPMGAFEDKEIDNDITKVIKALEEF
ncbi:ATP-binding protein [Eubacterium limosum]|uniref:ATP-binding protein n=1 Tax=Eubacterium limosum TaxID=1736 RepID=A0AAC9QQU1_EUBLI|nr:ATP-binding protein [Eubacterium limosum]ARD64055.1 ATP-binding protein [Eubacterium limosum]PWW59881.1 AAA domain-containing protein [Eubacterium limosum]UQZ21974.1 ATP-binding protein [Eubacterium limosum]